MTAQALDTVEVIRGRGRPSNAQLSDRLERAHLVNVSLREQLRAERLEGRELAANVRTRALRTSFLVQAELLLEAHQEAVSTAAIADRFIRQRNPGAHV